MPQLRRLRQKRWRRTYRTVPAITRHLLYLLVRKGMTPALSGVPDTKNRKGDTSITARIDLFWRFKGVMTSYRSFCSASHEWPPLRYMKTKGRFGVVNGSGGC